MSNYLTEINYAEQDLLQPAEDSPEQAKSRGELPDAALRMSGKLSGHQQSVLDIKVLDEDIIASVGDDATIKIWNTASQSLLRTLTGHTQAVLGICQVTQKYILSFSRDKTFRLWDWTTGYQIKELQWENHVIHQIVKYDDTRVLFGTENGIIGLFDMRDDKTCRAYNAHYNYRINQIIFNRPKKQIITCSNETRIKVWEDILLCGQGTQEPAKVLEGHEDAVLDIKLQAGTNLLISAGYDMFILVWDLTTCAALTVLREEDVVWKLALYSDALFLAASENSQLRLYQSKEGALVQSLEGTQFALYALAVDAQKRILCAGKDSCIYIFE